MKLSDSRGLSLLLVGLLTLLPLQRLSAQTGQTTQADKDKSFSLNIDGRLTFDAATYFVPGSSDLRYSGAPFRMSPASQVSQARIAAVVGLDRWSGRFDLDFVRARVTLCDLFVRYSYAPQANITVGYIFDPISIGINTATRHRSVNLAPAVAPLAQSSRHWSIHWRQWGRNYWLSAALAAGGIESINASPNHYSEGYGISARAVWLPSPEPDRLIHLGIAGTVRAGDRSQNPLGSFTLRAAPSSDVDGRSFILKTLTGVQRYEILGLEAALRTPKVYLLGEGLYTRVGYDPTVTDPEKLQSGLFVSPHSYSNHYGGYIEGSYMLRGTQRKYLKAASVFNNVADEVSPGGNLELMARLSYLNARTGGASTDALVALNWFPSSSVLLGLSYSYSQMNASASDGGKITRVGAAYDGLQVHCLQLRTQFVF